MTKRISTEQLVENFQAFAEELGRTPTADEMRRIGPHSHDTYYKRFGSWAAACEAAGHEPRHQDVDDEDLLDDLRRLADELGRTPTTGDVDRHGRFWQSTYHRRFGGFKDARERAGLPRSVERDGWDLRSEDLREKVRASASAEIAIDDTVPFDGGVAWD